MKFSHRRLAAILGFFTFLALLYIQLFGALVPVRSAPPPLDHIASPERQRHQSSPTIFGPLLSANPKLYAELKRPAARSSHPPPIISGVLSSNIEKAEDNEGKEVLTALLRSHVPSEGHTSSSSLASILPAWVVETCPEVLRHYSSFQYFSSSSFSSSSSFLPLSSASYAAELTCLLHHFYLVHSRTSHSSTPLLYAGSALGATLHFGQIPWDDDVDVLLPHGAINPLLGRCLDADAEPDFGCYLAKNAVKFFRREREEGGRGAEASRRNYPSPYVDVFFFIREDSGSFSFLSSSTPPSAAALEVFTTGRPKEGSSARSIPLTSLSTPPSLRYFGGFLFPTIGSSFLTTRYTAFYASRCVVGSFNHRLEKFNPQFGIFSCEEARSWQAPFADVVVVGEAAARGAEEWGVVARQALNRDGNVEIFSLEDRSGGNFECYRRREGGEFERVLPFVEHAGIFLS